MCGKPRKLYPPRTVGGGSADIREVFKALPMFVTFRRSSPEGIKQISIHVRMQLKTGQFVSFVNTKAQSNSRCIIIIAFQRWNIRWLCHPGFHGSPIDLLEPKVRTNIIHPAWAVTKSPFRVDAHKVGDEELG